MRFAERVGLGLALAGTCLLAGCQSLADLAAPPATAAVVAAPAPAPPAEAAAVAPQAQREFDAARQALAAKRFDEAERRFVALTKAHPELDSAHANLAIVYLQAGKPAEAIAALQRAVALNPREPRYLNQLGIAYREAGQFTKARDAYEQALAVDPKYARALVNLGILYDIYLRDGARALELYERYLALAPAGDDEVRKWISDLNNRMNRNRTDAQDAAGRKEQK